MKLIKKSPGFGEKAVTEAVWFLDYYINFAEENIKPIRLNKNII